MTPMNKGASVTNKAPSPQTQHRAAASSADKATMIAVMRIFMTKNITVHFITTEKKIFVTPYVIMLKVSVRILFAHDRIIASATPSLDGKVELKFQQILFSSVQEQIIQHIPSEATQTQTQHSHDTQFCQTFRLRTSNV